MKIPWDTKSCIQDIAKLLTTGQFSDVHLICEDFTFKCHMAILAARSSHFAAMFKKAKKNNDVVIRINDIDVMTLRALLKYIYCNQISKQDVNPELIKAASEYKLSALTYQCNKISLYKKWASITIYVPIFTREYT